MFFIWINSVILSSFSLVVSTPFLKTKTKTKKCINTIHSGLVQTILLPFSPYWTSTVSLPDFFSLSYRCVFGAPLRGGKKVLSTFLDPGPTYGPSKSTSPFNSFGWEESGAWSEDSVRSSPTLNLRILVSLKFPTARRCCLYWYVRY